MGLLQLILIALIIETGYTRRTHDPTNDLDEDGFLAEFGLPMIRNRQTKIKRNAELKKHERIIRRQNLQYANGVRTSWDKLNDFADLPEAEVVKTKMGLNVKRKRIPCGRGLIPNTNYTD